MTTPDLIIVNDSDNVATALRNVQPGVMARIANARGETQLLTPLVEIRLGHKVALAPIAAGDLVIKHGHPIGRATSDIEPGDHVHVHNVISLSLETDIEPLAEGV